MGKLVLILIILGIGLIVQYWLKQDYIDKIKSGELPKRDYIFLKQSHYFYFTNSSSSKDIIAVLDREKFEKYRLEFFEDEKYFMFKIKDSYSILYDVTVDGEKAVCFKLMQYKGTLPALIEPYNVLLTEIEKISKNLDENVEVQRIVNEFHQSKED